MKKTNLLNIILLFGETALIIGVGTILMNLNLHSWINFIFYLLLLLEILWVFKITKNNECTNEKGVAILSFVMVAIGHFSMLTAKEFTNIPVVCTTSHLFLMGYLAFNGCINISKYNSQNSSSKTAKIIGFIIFTLSVFVAFLVIFGLAKT